MFSACKKRELENTEHDMDNLKCWLPKELAISALKCGVMTVFKISFNLFICLSLRLSFGRVHVCSQGCGGKAIETLRMYHHH